MQIEVFFKNGIRLASSQDLVKAVYNNPGIEKIVLHKDNFHFSLFLQPGMRLIFFREIKIGNSAPETTYNVGYQKNVKGRNIKVLMKIMPNNEVVLIDG